jgi:hypothetical protein
MIKQVMVGIPKIGDILHFGKYDWCVLDVQNGQALLLADKVTHTGIPYNKEWAEVTWEACTLRRWLNSDFLTQTFTVQEQAGIVQKIILNENNQWYGRKGGNATTDKVFLLSLSEIIRYFGDSEQLNKRPGKGTRYIDDQYNPTRIATRSDGIPVWWWLRSSGILRHAANIGADGCVVVGGHRVDDGHAPGGVRPAFWLNMESLISRHGEADGKFLMKKPTGYTSSDLQ